METFIGDEIMSRNLLHLYFHIPEASRAKPLGGLGCWNRNILGFVSFVLGFFNSKNFLDLAH